jgi:succinate dehydrogenase flavin-adding protein (antitoxin of CptAB toxin-antitoxin module)
MACLVLQQVRIKIQALRKLPEERKQEFTRARQCSDKSLLHLVLAKRKNKEIGN